MEQPQSRRCKREGCHSDDVVLGDMYCQEHLRQYFQDRISQPDKSLLQPDKHQASRGPISHPPLDPLRNAATAFPNRVTENGFLNTFPSTGSGTASPTNEKKQLPDKKVARKSTKQPPIASASPSIRRPANETPSTSPREAKKPRLSSVATAPELLPRSNSSSFSENGVPHPSKRGMFRQSEERPRKLSAVDDFALRPKKREAANESSGSKAYDDSRRLHRGESYRSSSSRPTPTPSRTPQATVLTRNVSSASFVIDLTKDSNSESLLSRPRQPGAPPNHDVSNGTAETHQQQQRHSDNIQAIPRVRSGFVAVNDRQRWEEAQQAQLSKGSQAQQSRSVEQGSRRLHAEKPPQNTAPSPSVVHPTFKPVNGISREPPVNKQKMNVPAPSNGIGSVRNDSSGIPTQHHTTPKVNEHQVANGIWPFPLSKKNSVPFNTGMGRLEIEHKTSTKPTKATSQATSLPNPTMAPKPRAIEIEPPHHVNGTKPTTQLKQPAHIPNAAFAPPPRGTGADLRHHNNGKQSFMQNETSAPTSNVKLTNLPQAMEIDSPQRTKRVQPAMQKEKPASPPSATMTPQPHAMEVDSPHLINGKQQAAHSEKHTNTPQIDAPQSASIIPQGPLSVLLGGRKWTKMSPEERRLFWVSQHDPVKFDAQIYSEQNRPFRPGDALFQVAEYALPPRPTRPATSFDYIDPRTHYSQQYSAEWYQKKQAEISARGNWKANRETLKQNKQHQPEAPAPKTNPKQNHKHKDLPQYVQDNPQWLAALDVLENMEAQARDRRANKDRMRRTTKEKAKATMNAELDVDADVESS